VLVAEGGGEIRLEGAALGAPPPLVCAFRAAAGGAAALALTPATRVAEDAVRCALPSLSAALRAGTSSIAISVESADGALASNALALPLRAAPRVEALTPRAGALPGVGDAPATVALLGSGFGEWPVGSVFCSWAATAPRAGGARTLALPSAPLAVTNDSSATCALPTRAALLAVTGSVAEAEPALLALRLVFLGEAGAAEAATGASGGSGSAAIAAIASGHAFRILAAPPRLSRVSPGALLEGTQTIALLSLSGSAAPAGAA
jgi:hypothetical protein